MISKRWFVLFSQSKLTRVKSGLRAANRAGSALLTNKCSGMVLFVRLYAHYAGAPFLHKFAQTVPSTDRMALGGIREI